VSVTVGNDKLVDLKDEPAKPGFSPKESLEDPEKFKTLVLMPPQI